MEPGWRGGGRHLARVFEVGKAVAEVLSGFETRPFTIAIRIKFCETCLRRCIGFQSQKLVVLIGNGLGATRGAGLQRVHSLQYL
jgi:hypothetical protein